VTDLRPALQLRPQHGRRQSGPQFTSAGVQAAPSVTIPLAADAVAHRENLRCSCTRRTELSPQWGENDARRRSTFSRERSRPRQLPIEEVLAWQAPSDATGQITYDMFHYAGEQPHLAAHNRSDESQSWYAVTDVESRPSVVGSSHTCPTYEADADHVAARRPGGSSPTCTRLV